MNEQVTKLQSDKGDGRKVSPTRLKVLQVAANLFADRGYSGVGVNEISEATGLGRGALYYHISSKEDLLYDITTAYMSDLITDGRAIAEAETDPVERVRALSRALMMTISEHLSEMTVCFRELHALTDERRRAVTGLHSDYQAIWAMALSDGLLWLTPRGPQNAADIGNAFADVVLNSVRK